MNFWKLFLSAIAIFTFSVSSFSQCKCNELTKSFYANTMVIRTSDFTMDVRIFFGSDKFNDYLKTKSDSKYNIDMPIEGVSADEADNPENSVYSQLQYSILHGSANYYNAGWANYMVLQLANDSVAAIYNKCKEACNKGLSVEIISDQNDKVALIVKWIPYDTVKQVVTEKVILYGAKVQNHYDLKEGNIINADGRIIVLTREEGEDLIAVINLKDNKGQKYINLPPKRIPHYSEKDQFVGDWLNSTINFDSTLIDYWGKCAEMKKSKVPTKGSKSGSDKKNIYLQNMVLALTKINEIKTEMNKMFTNPKANRVQILLEQPRLKEFEKQFNTERAKLLKDEKLIKQPKSFDGVY